MNPNNSTPVAKIPATDPPMTPTAPRITVAIQTAHGVDGRTRCLGSACQNAKCTKPTCPNRARLAVEAAAAAAAAAEEKKAARAAELQARRDQAAAEAARRREEYLARLPPKARAAAEYPQPESLPKPETCRHNRARFEWMHYDYFLYRWGYDAAMARYTEAHGDKNWEEDEKLNWIPYYRHCHFCQKDEARQARGQGGQAGRPNQAGRSNQASPSNADA